MKEALAKRLRTRLADEKAKVMSYKEALQTLNADVKEQNEKLCKLEGSTYRAEELKKVNTNLVIELMTLCKQID